MATSGQPEERRHAGMQVRMPSGTEPSKLVMRVPFPSPAPSSEPPVRYAALEGPHHVISASASPGWEQ